jgi:hypothetical protein
MRTEVIGSTEFDSYMTETIVYTSWCDYVTEPDCVAETETYTEDFYGNEIVYDESNTDGTREIMKVSPDGLYEENTYFYSDGSQEVIRRWYEDEESWDFDMEIESWNADGSYSVEYTDRWGNTDSYETDATGNEVLGGYCYPEDPSEGDQWCYESYIDMDGNTWETETAPDGTVCTYTYYWDGRYMDCDANMWSPDGYMILDQFIDEDTGNEVFVKEGEDGNVITETCDWATGECTEVISNVDGLTVVYEEYDTQGNYVVYLEDAMSGDRIIEVYDYMGYITTTIYPADGSDPITHKMDEWGNEVNEGYYDENDNYVTVYFDSAL